jgi:hypothetical protein
VGVFVTVNRTNGQGRKTHNIIEVRALFVDLDGPPLEPVLSASLEPHIVVESSPQRYHAYWLCDNCPLDKFGDAQKALVARFDGDDVHDLPRVMRLPGFLHGKGKPFLTRVLPDVGFTGPPYSFDEIVTALGLDLKAAGRSSDKLRRGDNDDAAAGDETIPRGRRNATITSIAGRMRRAGMTASEMRAALSAINTARCSDPLENREVEAIARSVARYPPAMHDDQAQDGTSSRRPPESERIVQMVLAHYDLYRSETGDPYALRRDGPAIALPLRGARAALRGALAREYRDTHGRVPSASLLADAMIVIEGRAFDAPIRPTHLRVARHDEAIVIDLGRADGQVLRVDANGWQVMPDSSVVWRRTRLSGELPLPERGGSLDELHAILAVTDETWPIVLGWHIAAYIPDIAHPVLLLGGLQGTGKTTMARTIVAQLDPSPAPVRAEPNDVEGWTVAAAGSWVVAVDNVSAIHAWWSDAICRAVTGDGLVRRARYTDSEVSVIALRRCVILTAIDAGALRGDLGDRIVLVDLAPIAASRRRTDTDLDAALAVAGPRILGALLDLLSAVLRELPRVQLSELPRMADFARVLAAMDAAIGTDALERYLGQADRVAADVVDGDPVAVAIRDLGDWTGTAADLYDRITSERPPRGWPPIPRSLVQRLQRVAPALRAVGVAVTIGEHTRRGRMVHITVLKAEGQLVGSAPAVAHPELIALRERSDRGDEPATRELIKRIRAIQCDQRRRWQARLRAQGRWPV